MDKKKKILIGVGLAAASVLAFVLIKKGASPITSTTKPGEVIKDTMGNTFSLGNALADGFMVVQNGVPKAGTSAVRLYLINGEAYQSNSAGANYIYDASTDWWKSV